LHYDGNDWTAFDAASIGFSPYISGLSVSPDGAVYAFGLPLEPGGASLFRFSDEQWAELPLPSGYTYYDFWADKLHNSPDGHLWLPMRDEHNAAMEYDGASWIMHDLAAMGLSGERLHQFQVDAAGRRWMLYGWKLYAHHQGLLEQALPANCAMPSSRMRGLTIDPYQAKWFKHGDNLVKFDGLEWQAFPLDANLPAILHFESFAADVYGNIWFYYNPENLWVKFDGASYEAIPVTDYGGTSPAFLVSDYSFDLAGRLWIANGGPRVAHYDGQQWQYSQELVPEGSSLPLPFPHDFIQSIAADPQGFVWCMGEQLYRFDGTTWERQPVYTPYDLVFEWAGSKLFAGKYGLWTWKGGAGGVPSLYRLDGTQWEPQNAVLQALSNADSSQGSLFGLAEDSRGNTWVASSKGLFKYDGDTWQHLHAMNSNLPDNQVYSLAIDQRDNIWVQVYANHLAVYNETGITHIGAEPLSGFAGTVFYDANENGAIDAGDIPLPYQRVWNVTDDNYVFSGTDGKYRAYAIPGEYEVQVFPLPGWTPQGDTQSYVLQLDSLFLEGFDFLVKPIGIPRAITAHFTAGFTRCNSPAPHWISVHNNGALSGAAELRLTYDERCEYLSAWPLPDEVDNHTLVWQTPGLPPFGSFPIELELLMPDEQSTGEMLSYLLVVEGSFVDGTTTAPDSAEYSAVVRCAYDPNDKLASSEGYFEGSHVAWDAPLVYTVRFQNTGNDTAYTVIIVDTLDRNLDLHTFELISHSHPMRATLSSEGVLHFIFENIYLPDSTTDFAGSQGFVKYRIRGDGGGLPLLVQNTAQIYFDFNEPIITNTTENWLVEWVSSTSAPGKRELPVKVMPNPAAHRVLLFAEEPFSAGTFFSIHSVGGQVLRTEKMAAASQMHELDMSALPPGIYFVQILSDRGSATKKVVKY
jgi:hypothetical protein